MLGDAGGMDIPMNQPRGNSQNKRWEERGGKEAADFPKSIVVEKPLNRQAK
jgi:N-acetylglucosamine-6-sulfatase